MEKFLAIIGDLIKGSKRFQADWRTIDWLGLYRFAKEQTVLGVLFDELTKYESSVKDIIPKEILFQCLGYVEQIRIRNIIINERCSELTSFFSERGYRSCILKGQGNAQMYPNPYTRTPGDIDIWIEGETSNIVHLVTSMFPDVEIASHHVDFPIFSDVPVEVHFSPSFSVVKRYDKKWMQYVQEHASEQFSHMIRLPDSNEDIPVPETDFNIIFQLSHMMRHFFYEGIGLRHIIDFYYLLLQERKRTSEDTLKLLKDLGMLKFAQGLMWIEQEYFGLDEKFLICMPDRKRGKLILREIFEGGNFGKNDKRKAAHLAKRSKTLSVMLRNLHLLWLFPEEALAAPIDGVIRKFIISKRIEKQLSI